MPLAKKPTAERGFGAGKIETIRIDSIIIDPGAKTRRRLGDLAELADSIRDHGLLQPLVVRRDPGNKGRYYLVAGHRRMAALQLLTAGKSGSEWTSIPALVRDAEPDQAYVLTLVENLQRDDLSATEESEALARLVRERRWTTRQVASAIRRSQPYVSRRLRVYDDRILRTYVLDKQLPVSVAEELLAAEADNRAGLAKRAVGEGWDQKRARAEARGHTAAFHPQLRKQVHELRELVSHASLSIGELQLLRQLAEFLLSELPSAEVISP